MIKTFTFLHYRLQHFFHCYFPTNTWHVPPMYNHMACTPMACTHDHCLYGSSIEEVCAFVIFETFSHWVYMLRFILRLLYFFRFHFIWGGGIILLGGGGQYPITCLSITKFQRHCITPFRETNKEIFPKFWIVNGNFQNQLTISFLKSILNYYLPDPSTMVHHTNTTLLEQK